MRSSRGAGGGLLIERPRILACRAEREEGFIECPRTIIFRAERKHTRKYRKLGIISCFPNAGADEMDALFIQGWMEAFGSEKNIRIFVMIPKAGRGNGRRKETHQIFAATKEIHGTTRRTATTAVPLPAAHKN